MRRRDEEDDTANEVVVTMKIYSDLDSLSAGEQQKWDQKINALNQFLSLGFDLSRKIKNSKVSLICECNFQIWFRFDDKLEVLIGSISKIEALGFTR